ncbi:MAG: DNA (cytosine-5-)-methyltransferase [Pseudobdellovibrionaceae bacterium]|nr:DNA (cytosine-5-)-methyltransferase [Pseudobdellovibrionaceae bacterium]
MKIASIFCGAGGLDFGFAETPGFEFVFANDWNKHACETYRKNFAKLFKHDTSYVHQGDILKLWTNIPQGVDLLIGGPPCQSWSRAGKGKGAEDPRGQLIVQAVEILKEKRPRFFMWENVLGILDKKHADSFDDLLNTIEKQGYNVTFRSLDLWKYGVPQNRKRVIIVGVRDDQPFKPDQFYPPQTQKVPIKSEVIFRLLDHLALQADIKDKAILNDNFFRYNKEAQSFMADVLQAGGKFRLEPEFKLDLKKSFDQRQHIEAFLAAAEAKAKEYDRKVSESIVAQIDFLATMEPFLNNQGGIGTWTEEETWDWL